jgi:hypothetical protein
MVAHPCVSEKLESLVIPECRAALQSGVFRKSSKYTKDGWRKGIRDQREVEITTVEKKYPWFSPFSLEGRKNHLIPDA